MSVAPDELRALADRVADDPISWSSLVRHDPGERIFVKLRQDEASEVWLICWMDGHDTGFHDHDGSAGAVRVVRGAVQEERLVVGGEPVSRVAAAGESFTFSPFDIHRVRHAGLGPAITIHAYSPVLRRMGAYVVEPDGRLARHAMDCEEELRPMVASRL
jgi:predicted metal-dependent enzyme (double-stranded beta helix superfamily)